MFFRLYVFKDPESETRGYSLKGLKIPLRTFCPIKPNSQTKSYDDSPTIENPFYTEYWSVLVEDIIRIKPTLQYKLRGLTHLLIPTDWCDIAPVDNTFYYKLK
jgi:hypothetical protein